MRLSRKVFVRPEQKLEDRILHDVAQIQTYTYIRMHVLFDGHV